MTENKLSEIFGLYSMKKINCFPIFFLPWLIISYPLPAKEIVSWRSLVKKMQESVTAGNLGKDFSLIFSEEPTGKVLTKPFQYTLSGDGKVSLHFGEEKKELEIPQEEVFWLCRSLSEYKLADIPETQEIFVCDASSYFLTLRIGDMKKEIYLSSLGEEEENRLILWQYLFRFGQQLMEKAGLRDRNQPILPIWKGIIKEEKIDSDQDGLIDWLHLWIGFYSLKPGSFIVGYYPGGSQKTSFHLGDTHKEFFVNGYELRRWEKRREERPRGSLRISMPSQKFGETEVIEVPLVSGKHKQEEFRATPDLTFKGSSKWRFRVYLNQTINLRMKSSPPLENETFWWFSLEEISPRGIKLGKGSDSEIMKVGENKNWGFGWHWSNLFSLIEVL